MSVSDLLVQESGQDWGAVRKCRSDDDGLPLLPSSVTVHEGKGHSEAGAIARDGGFGVIR